MQLTPKQIISVITVATCSALNAAFFLSLAFGLSVRNWSAILGYIIGCVAVYAVHHWVFHNS